MYLPMMARSEGGLDFGFSTRSSTLYTPGATFLPFIMPYRWAWLFGTFCTARMLVPYLLKTSTICFMAGVFESIMSSLRKTANGSLLIRFFVIPMACPSPSGFFCLV